MAHFDVDCFRDEYYRIVQRVAARGVERSPRGIGTRDLGYTTIVLHNVFEPVLPIGTGRGISQAVAALEALQLIGSISTPDLLVKAAPHFASFMERDRFEELSHFHGAYGVRIGMQVDACIRKLREDPNTRQAVVTLWNPELDNLRGKRDYPCTVALGFALVDDHLNLTAIMRSNDVWLGLPYDVFQFTQLQWTVANVLGVTPGAYTHTAWSLHLYDDVADAPDRVRVPKPLQYSQPHGIVADTWSEARQTARNLLNGGQWAIHKTNDEGEDRVWSEWYADAVASVVEHGVDRDG